MKKIIILIVIIMLLCGCVHYEITPSEQAAIEAISMEEDNEQQTEIPVTVIPTATDDIDEVFDLSIDFDVNERELTGNHVGQNEILTLKEFDFGVGRILQSSTQITAATDDEGNIYFVDGKGISVIEASNGDVKPFKEAANIKAEYVYDKLTENCRYVGVMYIESILYFIIQTEPEYFEYNYYIANSETGEISENYLIKPIGYCGTKVLDVSGHNDEQNRFDYRFYDVIEEEFYDIDLDTIENNSRIITEVAFATEDYFLLINSDNSSQEADATVINKNLFFINSKTFKLEAIYPLLRNGIFKLHIFDYKEGKLYFFEDENNNIKTLNPNTWELNRLCYFEKQTLFNGYNSDTQILYLKQRFNYEHACGIFYGYNCFEEYLDDGFDAFFEYNLENNEYRITNKVYLKDELNDSVECLNQLSEHKLGNYIVSILEDRYEGGLEIFSTNFLYDLNKGEFIKLP